MTKQLAPELIDADSNDLYRTSLGLYSPAVLRGIRDHLELDVSARSAAGLVKAIEECLSDPARRATAVTDVPAELRPGLALLPYLPKFGWRLEDMRDLLRFVGCTAPDKSMRMLLGLGLMALHAPAWRVETLRHFDLAMNGWEGEQLVVVPHPAVSHHFNGAVFDAPKRGVTRQVRDVRENDGREFLLRVAVLWQRVVEAPLRLTQDAGLFRRDQERLYSDPVLSSPMFDELAPLDDHGHLAMLLGKSLGLLRPDDDGGVLRATLGTAWQSSIAVLQQRMWHALLSANDWTPPSGDDAPAIGSNHLPAKRWAVLLRLATLRPDSWLSLAELDADLRACEPDRGATVAERGTRPFQVVVGRYSRDAQAAPARPEIAPWLSGFLLGAMYQLGVVHTAEDAADAGPVVRLSPAGRWLLGAGPQPPEPPAFEKTLFVQPNHEVIAYRQGLTPELIGQLASFCRWKGLGAAATLELTPDSVYRGLEFGRTAEEMIGILERHSQRPVPPAVADSVRTWAGRRERLRLYTHASVLEIASAEELEAAVARGVAGDRLNDRMLLVSGEHQIALAGFRLSGSRDYRHPPAVCVSPSDDGITWDVDLARSDLLVGCELARFAEPVATDTEFNPEQAHFLRFRITPASLANGARHGVRPQHIRDWFKQRSGLELPASVELMLQASSRAPVMLASMLVLQIPSASVADGIEQHPDTKQFVLRRLGPTTLAIKTDGVEQLTQTLLRLGIEVAAQ